MLKKEYVRDGNRRIIGSVTSGYSDTTAVVRDETKSDRRAHQRTFHKYPRRTGQIGFINSADPGLLIRRKK